MKGPTLEPPSFLSCPYVEGGPWTGGLTLTPSLHLLAPQLHTGPDPEADVLTECLALQQLHGSTQLAASDRKGGRTLGQELLPGMCAERQGLVHGPAGDHQAL